LKDLQFPGPGGRENLILKELNWHLKRKEKKIKLENILMLGRLRGVQRNCNFVRALLAFLSKF
jgi:hypothetical protein